MNISYEDAKKGAWKGFWILLAVTIVEVLIALFGNGHLIEGFRLNGILRFFVMILIMIALSAYKAKFIVMEFMHLGHEVKSMAMTVILPTLLLVWAIIAFLWEGNYWERRRNDGKEVEKEQSTNKTQGFVPAKDLSNEAKVF
jgi:cytochrome c oxidase subunit IV